MKPHKIVDGRCVRCLSLPIVGDAGFCRAHLSDEYAAGLEAAAAICDASAARFARQSALVPSFSDCVMYARLAAEVRNVATATREAKVAHEALLEPRTQGRQPPMSAFVFRQPNGYFGIFSTIVDSVTIYNLDERSMLAYLTHQMGPRDGEQKLWRALADLPPAQHRHYREKPPIAPTLGRFDTAMEDWRDRAEAEQWRAEATRPPTDLWVWDCAACGQAVSATTGNLPTPCCPVPTLVPMVECEQEPMERIVMAEDSDEEGRVLHAIAMYGGSAAGVHPGVIAWATPLHGHYAACVRAAMEGAEAPVRAPRQDHT